MSDKKFTVLNPDFDQTIWVRVEEKLSRKLLPVENMGIFQTTGMFKEWFFGSLDSMPIEEVERIVSLRADYVYGWANRPDKPERKGQPIPWLKPPKEAQHEKEPVEPLWKFLFNLFFK